MADYSHNLCQEHLTGKSAPRISEYEKTMTIQKSQRNTWSVAQQWSRMREVIGKQKVISFESTRLVKGCDLKTTSNVNSSGGQAFFPNQETKVEDEQLNHADNLHSDARYVCSSRHGSQHNQREHERHSRRGCRSDTSLSHKYEPKTFNDIVGQEIIIRVISNAIEKKKIAHLYLFHGPSGTGKTSTARIFAMALQCESTSLEKPCWSCRGCSMSLYIMKLCSGSGTAGFQKIKTLLQSSCFAQEVPGFKVFIIEESQFLAAEAWDELLGILEKTYTYSLVFVLITMDANMISKLISSRCQKFCFLRLENLDVTAKLARIVMGEDIEIEEEALRLIVTKAEGSLREAERLLDQLTLLGPKLTCHMVQKFVGLVPRHNLITLLEAALSGDTKKTVDSTTELIATGFEAEAILHQLTSLITDMISGAAVTIPDSSALAGPSKDKRLMKSESQLSNNQMEKLYHALKILVEAENQIGPSICHTTQIYATVLQIALQDVSDGISSRISFCREDKILSHFQNWENYYPISKTSEQHHMDGRDLCTSHGNSPNRKEKSIDKAMRCSNKVEMDFNLSCMRDMHNIWSNILDNIQGRNAKELLDHAKLASLTVSSANIIVHLIFKRAEDKLAAQMCEESILTALKSALGCPVTVNMSVEPVDMVRIQESTTFTNKCQAEQKREQLQKQFPAELVHETNPGAVMHQRACRQLALLSDNIPRLTEFKDRTSMSEGRNRSPAGETESTTSWPNQMLTSTGHLIQENQLKVFVSATPNSLASNQFEQNMSHIMRTEEPNNRQMSLSSIQRSDASVESYSQDILFENAKTDKESRKNTCFSKGISKVHEDYNWPEGRKTPGLFRSWSCKEAVYQRKTKAQAR